jgi:putative PIN family toxin of toxin-antitoxin system
MRIVIDTNVFVSMVIRPGHLSDAIIDKIDRGAIVLYSAETLSELIEVLGRRKFARYTTKEDIAAFVGWFADAGELVTVTREVQASADPKDDKFLSLAVSGRADAIISGDKKHLLSLGSFESVPIFSPADFIAKMGN